jgi:MraZ protein
MANRADRAAKFIGRFVNKIDDKGRTFLPARLKPLIYARWGHRPDLVLAVMGFDRCLVLVDREKWFEKRARLDGLDWMDRDAARLRRLSSLAEEVSVDRQDRMSIPHFLRKFAQLEDEVMFVGCEDYIELWNPANADMDLDELLKDAGDVIARVREQGEKPASSAAEAGADVV